MKNLVFSFCLAIVCIPSLVIAQIPTNGLVAYYPFNGDANDSSGNGNNGTVNGASLATDRFGNPNNAYSVVAGNYISVPHNPAFNVSSDMTISAWFKTTGSGSPMDYLTIVCKRDDNFGVPTSFWDLTIEVVSQKMGFFLFNNFSSLDYQLSQRTINTSVWQHVVAVVKNDTSYIYLDGVLDSSSPITIPRPTNTQPLLFGWDRDTSPTSESFLGSIDDIRIYNRAINTNEIDSLYHEGGYDPSLVAYYPFNGNANDESGNGNNGTVIGATLTTDRFGASGKAYHFNGTDSYINGTSAASMQNISALTISAWIRLDTSSTETHVAIFSKNTPSTTTDFALVVGMGTPRRLHPNAMVSGQWKTFYGSTNIQGSSWHHVTMTYDGSDLKSYVDGINDGTLSVPGVLSSSNNNINIGAYDPGNVPIWFKGELDDIRVYNRTLSASDILALYNEGGWNVILPVELSSLMASYSTSHILLRWRTETEVHNYGFDIERRTVREFSFQWNKIGFVAGSGTTSSPREYSFTDKNFSPSRYAYRLKQIDNDGAFKYYGDAEVEVLAPSTFALEQNYPNPFNPSTIFKFALPDRSSVKVQIFNILGQHTATLVDEELDAGSHLTTWNANVASGMYFCRIEAVAVGDPSKQFVDVKKMILLK